MDLLHLLLSEALPLGFVDQVAHFGRFCDGEENLEVFRPAFDLFLEALNLELAFRALGDQGFHYALLLAFELFECLIELLGQTGVFFP